MMYAPIKEDEGERIEALHSFAILDTPSEKRFDILTQEAVLKLKVPISTISILDSKREWYKSCVGLDVKEASRDTSFCGHALYSSQLFVVEDTLEDERFKDNPLVVNSPFIRFYAGIALYDYKSGKPMGVFCIKDIKPRKLSTVEVGILIDLANRAEVELNKNKV